MFHYHNELREYGKLLTDPTAARHLDFTLQIVVTILGVNNMNA